MNQLHRKSGLITPITNPPKDDKITQQARLFYHPEQRKSRKDETHE